MTFRLSGPRFYAWDANGAPLAGGEVYAYEAGTSTPKDTYTDSEKSATNANPVPLDASGSAAIALDGSYKIVVKDSAGVTIFTQDNVTTPPTGTDVTLAVAAAQVVPAFADLGSAATQTVDGTVKRCLVAGYGSSTDGGGAHYKRVDAQPAHTLRFRSIDRYISDGTINSTDGGWWEIDTPIIDARSAGYAPDGLTASAAANATALAACVAFLDDKSGGQMTIPPGTAHMNAALDLDTLTGATIHAPGVVLDFTQASSTVGLDVGAGSGIEIIGALEIKNADSHGVHVSGAVDGLALRDVHCRSNGGDGFRFDAGTRVLLDQCRSTSNTDEGFGFDGGTQHDALTLVAAEAASNGGDGISIINARGVILENCKATSNTSEGIYIANVDGLDIRSPTVTGNTSSGIKAEATDALNTAHDIDNVRGRISGSYAASNGGSMTLETVTTGSGLVDLRLVGAVDAGATTSVSESGDGVSLREDGGSFSGTVPVSVSFPVGLQILTKNNTFSVPDRDFTIPSGAKRVTITFDAVTFNTADVPAIELGDSGGAEESGYAGHIFEPGVGATAHSTEFVLARNGSTSATYFGSVVLDLADASANTWVATIVISRGDTTVAYYGAGSKSLSEELTTVRVTSAGGTANFVAGSNGGSYER